jgi:hypothetical protein
MHCALLAICFEIVMHVHSPLTRPFPYAIRMMEVCAGGWVGGSVCGWVGVCVGG